MANTIDKDRETLNILLIEDDEDDWLLTRSLLSEIEGAKRYDLEWVTTYDAAVKLISEKHYDACLVDFRLGERTGLELVRQTAGIQRSLPFILLTGQDDRSVDEEAMATGVADFLVKSQVTAPLLERAIRYGIERKRIEKQLTVLADFDSLTGLANRAQFHRNLKQELAAAKRTGRTLAILFLDLDHFKNINDSIGHSVGDQLLKTVAECLQACCRETDTVARLGGDEFAIIATHFNDEMGVETVAKKIIKSLSQPFVLGGHTVHTGVSIGITVYPTDEDDIEHLLSNADMAMYRAKAGGRNTYRFFDAKLNEEMRERRDLELDIRHSLANNGFSVHYQPQFDIASGRIIGVEALARWVRPGHKTVPPSKFIPITESIGLISHFGEHMLRIACADCKAWQLRGLSDIGVAVNVSPSQFRHSEFVGTFMKILEDSGLPPHHLEIELTEETVMKDFEGAANALLKLREEGVRVAIDDFGTGYSSLSYLKRFPVDRLKIDQSFIAGVENQSGDHAITRAIIRLGGGLGIAVTAEGVETSEQLDFLKSEKCDSAQGYYFAKPMPFAEFVAAMDAGETGSGGQTVALAQMR